MSDIGSIRRLVPFAPGPLAGLYQGAAAFILAATVLAAFAAGAQAQKVSISNCANPLPNPPFGNTGCVLAELADANGGSITVEPPINPPVKVVFQFDKDSFGSPNPFPVGAAPSDLSKITVFPIRVGSATPGLQFTDGADQWKVDGGVPPQGFLSNAKQDVISYRVVALDPVTDQPVARIKDAEVSLGPGAVHSNNANAPARVLIRDVVSDDFGSSLVPAGGMQIFKSSDTAVGEDLEESSTFPHQSAVRVRKEVRPEPGSGANSVAEIEHVRQYISLTVDDEVGCRPGSPRRQDGVTGQAQPC